MLKKLRNKWKVGKLKFILILLTFALGGSLCAKISSILIAIIPNINGIVDGAIYIVILTIFWPISVLFVSLITGQFSFFLNYIKRIFNYFK